jgi:D-alanine-D-alanine ligase-like ATP-grasp enzyme
MVPPLFVKPAQQEASVGVREVVGLDQLSGALQEAKRFGDILVQRAAGQEITLTLFDDARGRLTALPVTTVVPKRASYFDDLAKRRPGRVALHTGTDARPLLLEAEVLSRDVYQEIGARGLVSFDLVGNEAEGLQLLDVNTVPTLTALTPLAAQLRAARVHPGALYDELIRRSL